MTDNVNRYILELTKEEIDFIAAAAHVLLRREPENTTVKQLITDLVVQTNFVSASPEAHGVGVANAITMQQQWGQSLGLDLSYYEQLITAQEIYESTY